MKKLLLIATVLLATLITLSITQDYTFNELLSNTLIIGGSTNTLLLFVWCVRNDIIKGRIESKFDEIVHDYNVLSANSIKTERELEDSKDTISKQVLTIDNHDKRVDILKAQELVTINLGDKVTRTNYFKIQTVYAMKENEYQLTKGGKWFKRDEIRKVEV